MDPVSPKPAPVEVRDELQHCPKCGYDQGFHVGFLRPSERDERLSLLLICPNCDGRFDIRKQL